MQLRFESHAVPWFVLSLERPCAHRRSLKGGSRRVSSSQRPTSQSSTFGLVPLVDSSFCFGALPFLLSVIAGATDVISFLGLDGLFTAHITGNLFNLAAHIVSGGPVPLGPVLSVPIFIIALSSA